MQWSANKKHEVFLAAAAAGKKWVAFLWNPAYTLNKEQEEGSRDGTASGADVCIF